MRDTFIYSSLEFYSRWKKHPHPILSRYSSKKLFEDETQFRRTSVKKTIFVEIKQISNAGRELENLFSVNIFLRKNKTHVLLKTIANTCKTEFLFSLCPYIHIITIYSAFVIVVSFIYRVLIQ